MCRIVLKWSPSISIPAGALLLVAAAICGAGCGGGSGSEVKLDPLCTAPDPGMLDYIDDMEDGDGFILQKDGRVSIWYTYDDSTAGTLNPAPDTMFPMETITEPRCGTSKRAMRVTGIGFSDWGSGFGFSLKVAMMNGEYVDTPYDATAARGITFWARKGETSVDSIRFAVGDQYSNPAGGHCDKTVTSGPTACYDAFGSTLMLTEKWQRFTFNFGQLGQRNFGLARPTLDVASLTDVQFGVPPAASVFDVWVDDIAFFR
jgi:hypothetical protein